MRYLLSTALAALLACCAPVEPPPPPPPAPAPAPIVVVPPVTKDPVTGVITMPAGADVQLGAPKVGPVALDLRARDSGGTFHLHVGDRVSISLIGAPTAGYQWTAPNPPGFLKLIGQTTGPTHTDQLKPGFTGGDHWQVTVYQAMKPGTGVLRFIERRPWEAGAPASAWSATLDVQ